MNLSVLYHPDIPDFIRELSACPEMLRLRQIGMNCGCEYTDFPVFRELAPYSRFDHSLGAALIVWHFTGSREQAAAALFHDIASPVFAHTVDFLNGDHERQESTEGRTESIILGSEPIRRTLARCEIPAEAVTDYHRYPIADNDSPRLSSDRLEYSLGNMTGFGFRTKEQAALYYGDLTVISNEEGIPELAFRTPEIALDFSEAALDCSRIYVSPADRFSMQLLSELLRTALHRQVIRCDDLWEDEPALIQKLKADPVCAGEWLRFRQFHRIISREDPAGAGITRVIPAKKRYIDPLTEAQGRVTGFSRHYREAVKEFLAEDFSLPVTGL